MDSIENIVAQTGVAGYISSNGSEALNTAENIVIATSAAIVSAFYGYLIHKNYRQAKVAEVRLEKVADQILLESRDFEVTSQRDKGIRNAFGYGFSLAMWYGFMKIYDMVGCVDMDDLVIRGMVASAIIATTAVYGPRYILTSQNKTDSLENVVSEQKVKK